MKGGREKTYSAAAPEMISMSSLVMTACLVRLKVRVSLSIISAGERQRNRSESHVTLYVGGEKPECTTQTESQPDVDVTICTLHDQYCLKC